MKCDGCTNDAIVHEVTIHNGVRVERHLCEQCARAQGVAVNPIAEAPLTSMLSQFVTVQALDAAQAATAQCPVCKLTFSQFKHEGKLGCPACYAAMEQHLSPLLQRAHEGGTHHVGKVPRRIPAQPTIAAAEPDGPSLAQRKAQAEARTRLMRQLRQDLTEAIKHEHYEKAARIRDQLRAIESGGAEPPPAAPARGDAP